MICQNLESILSYLRAALSLLNRVEQAVDRFLFWDEEVRICEEVVQVSGVHIRKQGSIQHLYRMVTWTVKTLGYLKLVSLPPINDGLR